MKALTRLSALVCLLLPTAMFAQSVPVNRTEILGRLVYRSSPSFIAHLIKKRGIEFTPSDSFLTQVKLAGGEGILVERLASGDFTVDRTSGKGDETSVEHLAKCAELVHTGAIESAEDECRAAIKENPKSPWPLLITAELLMRNEVRRAPTDPSDMSEEVARAREYDDLTNRAAALDPQGLANGQVEWVNINPVVFLSQNSATNPPQSSLGIAINEATIDQELGSSHRILALRSFTAQDWESAQRELQEAKRLEPAYTLNHNCLAKFYLSGKNENAAIAELRETIRIAPFDTEQRQALSGTLENLGRTQEAIEELKSLLVISPRNVEISNALVELYLEHKDLKSAITELQRFLKATSLILTDEAKFIEIRYWELDRLAGLLKRNKELDAAAEQYRFLLRYRPEDAGLHNDYGNVLMDQNRLDEAIDEYNLALRFEPNMSTAHHNIGICLARKNNLNGAIDEFRRALELNPEESHTQIFLGTALGQKGDLNAAKEQFQLYIEKNPKDPEAHASLGFALDQLKDTPGAIKELRRALELEPDSPEAENNLAWIYATAEDHKLRNPAEALVLARKAVKGSATPNPAYLDTLAEALLLTGQPAEALKTEQQAVALDPNNPEMRTRLAHFQAAFSPTSAAKQ
jgi:tetratricopeptide (TPR) repeat protein